jgi:Pyruvate/2-oxoacid:ferredoxin oxidoreductase delta subunit/predicted transcriptional regulator
MSGKDIYKELSKAINAGESKIIPMIFENICNDREARLLLSASPPKTIEELARDTAFPTNVVEEMVKTLFEKGLIYKSKKPDGTKYYRVRSIIQFHDATAIWKGATRDFLDLWKEYAEKELPQYMISRKESLGRSATRVIPIGKYIEPGSQILSFEDVNKIIEGARSLAVTKCSCRVIDGKCGKPLEVCLQIDKAADYGVERGTARPLTKEEALDIIKMAEREGLVHIADNRREDFHIICNCCSDCCVSWSSAKTKRMKVASPSRFLASVNETLCSSCAACVDACPFEAISIKEGKFESAEVDMERCMGCGVCTTVCPEGAISLKEARPPEFIPEVRR